MGRSGEPSSRVHHGRAAGETCVENDGIEGDLNSNVLFRMGLVGTASENAPGGASAIAPMSGRLVSVKLARLGNLLRSQVGFNRLLRVCHGDSRDELNRAVAIYVASIL